MKLAQENKRYPNGQSYIAITIDGHHVGHVEAIDGGYRPIGMRNTRPTLEQAVAAIIRSDLKRLHRHMVEIQKHLAALEQEG